MVLATSREKQEAPWRDDRARAALGGRLSGDDRRASIEVADEHDRLALAARSDGIPLYLEELARSRAAAPPFSEQAVPLPGSVPAALYEPLVARLYATPAALPVAATVAAAGQEVDRSLLAATIALPDEELDTTLRSLLDARILVTAEGRADRYHFRHELLREVAYELQPPSWRRKVHSRLCDLPDPARNPATGACSRRTSNARSATRRRLTPTGRRPRRRGGAARSTRPARSSAGRSS